MNKVVKWIKKEGLRVILAFIFFFLAFYLINFIQGLILKKDGFHIYNFLTIFIASVLVAKIMLIVDNLPRLDIFPKKPLIYNVFWKIFLYSGASFIVRFLDRLIPMLLKGEGYKAFSQSIDWYRFWGIQCLFISLFIVYVTITEIINAVGPARVRRLFFGK